jgi:hypothetical protein
MTWNNVATRLVEVNKPSARRTRRYMMRIQRTGMTHRRNVAQTWRSFLKVIVALALISNEMLKKLETTWRMIGVYEIHECPVGMLRSTVYFP